MATDDKVLTPAPSAQQLTTRRVRIPDHLNSWKPKYADWDLPDINITHLVTRFVGKFNVAAWNRSIELLLDKHPILNARVELDSDGADFTLKSQTGDLLTVVDLSTSQCNGQQTELKQLTAALVWQPFDRKGGPLFRAFMIRASERECILGIVVHHGIADGWSMGIIGRELLVGYAATICGRQNMLPAPEVQYLDYIEGMRDWLNGSEAQQQKRYWAQQMMDSRSIRLPMEPNVDLETRAEWAKESFKIEPDLVGAVCKRASQTHTTPFLLTLTAKIAAVAALTRSIDIVVAIVVEQRTHRRLRNTVGLLVNYLPIRASVNWTESFDELSSRVRATYLQACTNELYPYSLINVHEDVFPSFRFRRIIGEGELEERSTQGFQFFELPPPPPTRTPPKGAGHELFILHTDHSMSARVRYLPTLHRRETITHFTQVFRRALALGAFTAATPLSDLFES